MNVMTHPTELTTPMGEELILLAKRDYEALLAALSEAQEELADIEALDQARAEIAANPNALLPAEVSAQILAGRNRLGAIRHWRQISIPDLASKSGLEAAQIEDFETRKAAWGQQAAHKLAVALSVPEEWLSP